MEDPTFEAMEALNERCRCIGLDRAKLAESLASLPTEAPSVFAAYPVFIPRGHVDAMQRLVTALDTVAALPAYQEAVMAGRPEVVGVDHGPTGVFFGHDFHVGRSGPQLIEINTNAGGALLNVALARAQRACCSEVELLLGGSHDTADIEQTFVEMFRAEFRAQRGESAQLRRVAIVDQDPRKQFLYADFALVQSMLERAGIDAVIADPAELRLEREALVHKTGAIDLVYNRLTDFYLTDHDVLREAHVRGATVLTPHPRSYALHADKRNLELLSDPEQLARLGASADVAATVAAGVPRTVRVTAANADALWAGRTRLFFKPAMGFGSKATYRGAKLTRKTWDAILAAQYVAQDEVRPSQRTIDVEGVAVPLKVDIRSFVFRGQVQLLAARLYRGQTTNFRTAGGGFAPVYTDRA